MDSLTQITLGAAVGEAVLGRRIGNRAMLWGAIGGTIPDLDVLGNFFLDPIPALAFHRGVTHSLLFSVLFAFPLAFLVQRLYATQSHRRLWYKILVSLFLTALLFGVASGIFFVSGKTVWMLVILVPIGGYLLWRLYPFYLKKELESVDVPFGKWYLLFFLALSTHFVLDCFTAFGTQVFYPFSDYRVAFNNIAVVDPLYTIPFMICLLIASAIRREKKSRSRWNFAGIVISSLYMLFTIWNKHRVDNIFQNALNNRGLEISRCRTSPTIFNNFLWNCTAESDSVVYSGLYSIFDSDPNLHYLNVLHKNSHLAKDVDHLPEYATLQWFSDGYLLQATNDTAIVFSDIRYGGLGDTIRSYRDLVFNFYAVKQEDGSYQFYETRERPDDPGKAFRDLWVRMKGR